MRRIALSSANVFRVLLGSARCEGDLSSGTGESTLFSEMRAAKASSAPSDHANPVSEQDATPVQKEPPQRPPAGRKSRAKCSDTLPTQAVASSLPPAARGIVQSVADHLASLLASEGPSVMDAGGAGGVSAVLALLADRDLEVGLLRLEMLRERRVLSRRLLMEEVVRFLHCELSRLAVAAAAVPGVVPELPHGFNPVFELHQANRYVMKNMSGVAATHGPWLTSIGQGLAAEIAQQGVGVQTLQNLGARCHLRPAVPELLLSTAQLQDSKPLLSDGETALLRTAMRLFQLVASD